MTESNAGAAAQSSRADEPSQASRSVEVMLLLHVVDETLCGMHHVMHLMKDFQIYIQAQKDKARPLYRWSTYNGYLAINRATIKLKEISSKLTPGELSKDEAMFSLKQATKLSLSVSRIAISAMALMSEKCDTCVDEIDQSNLSEDSKLKAKVTVTNELKRLLKHCTEATAQIYATTDALRESIYTRTDEPETGTDLSTTLTLIRESEARASHKNWVWILALLLGLTAGVSTSLLTARLSNPAHSQIAKPQNIQLQHMELHTQQAILDRQQIAFRDQQAAFQTTTSRKLQGIQRDQEALREATQALTDRFDNLVESLGPTDAKGRYFARTVDYPVLSPGEENGLRKAINRTRTELQELEAKVLYMRKDFQLAEIRLEKRLNQKGR